MPELPDVEIYRRYIDATSLHQSIQSIQIKGKRLADSPISSIKRAVEHASFKETERIGKYLFVKLEGSDWLVFHFGMTGTLEYYKDDTAEERTPSHSQVLIRFSNGYTLAYISPRKLGKVLLAGSLEEFREKEGLGPDALSFTETEFLSLLHKKRGMIKTALMDQSSISGLGNIYTDEVLFQSGIHPKRESKTLSDKETRELFRGMRETLTTSIDAKADPSDMPKHFLLPRREPGATCPRCGGSIEKIKVGGRGTYFCPHCQSSEKP